MTFFLISAALLALPIFAQAQDTSFEKRLGSYYGLSLPSGTRLVIELHQTRNEWGDALYAGTKLTPSKNMTVSFGVSRSINEHGTVVENSSMLDQNSPAMRSLRQAQVEKLTSVESNGWRLAPTLSKWKPGFRIRYYTDRNRLESFQGEVKKDPLGGTQILFTYKREIFAF